MDMTVSTVRQTMEGQQSTLIRRVNQLYHEFTQASFDGDHRCRFEVEKPFWLRVAHLTLNRNGLHNPAQVTQRDAGACGRVVVDLACGTGFVTQTLSPWLTSADRLIAMDLGEAPLQTTMRKWKRLRDDAEDRPRLERVAMDAGVLPLADRSVDLLAMNASLHHVPSPIAVLREIDRVLRPGGFFALGFEPNRTHFASSAMTHLSGGLTRLSWYASPRQNMRRLRTWCAVRSSQTGRATRPQRDADAPCEDVIASVMNERLLNDGLIAEPLPEDRLLDLVDPYARGRAVGFDPAHLICETMPDYRVKLLNSSDYLGETMRRWPTVRGFVDAAFRTVVPRHGSLFSWLLCKPDHASEVAP